MNLFIETMQQRSERREREQRWHEQAHEATGAVRAAPSAREPIAQPCYSLEQETYQKELAFHRQRVRTSRLASVARVVLAVVLIPVGLAALFVASYAFTCIIDGATPGEVVELLQGFAGRVLAMVTGGAPQ